MASSSSSSSTAGDNSRSRDKISKCLSWLLRHGAVKEGFAVDEGGYVDVEDILKHKNFRNYTLVDIEKVVRTNSKQRFHMRTHPDTEKLQIRANQGHSILISNLELTPIVKADQIPMVVHGTYKKYLENIKIQGLSRVSRNHIHFATGEPEDKRITSGLRTNVEVLIYISLEKALNDGYKFYKSVNGVVLCPGNEDGFLPPTYFEKIVILN